MTPSLIRSLICALLLALAGCAANQPRLNVEVDVCCDARYERYETYAVTMTNVPGFLEAYLRGGLDTVLTGKGLEPTIDSPDLDVRLIFDQVFLTPDAVEEDPLGDRVEPGPPTRFTAAVSVDVLDASTQHIVWSGRLSRIHNDPYAQPRGNDHKMQGIIDGFATLFAEYPVRLSDVADERGPMP